MTARRHDVEVGDPDINRAFCTCGDGLRITDGLNDPIGVRLRLMLWSHEHQVEVLRAHLQER
jgi:hypothetical protein